MKMEILEVMMFVLENHIKMKFLSEHNLFMGDP